MNKKYKQVDIYLPDVNQTVVATWEELASSAGTTIQLFKRSCKELQQRGFATIREVQ